MVALFMMNLRHEERSGDFNSHRLFSSQGAIKAEAQVGIVRACHASLQTCPAASGALPLFKESMEVRSDTLKAGAVIIGWLTLSEDLRVLIEKRRLRLHVRSFLSFAPSEVALMTALLISPFMP
jgi:hypothetical protein